jgi:Zn-dependent protease
MYPQTTNKTIRFGPIKTSRTELIDITKAWLALSFAFALIFSGINLMRGTSLIRLISVDFWIMFLVSLFTAGLGFLLHELGHKFVAQHYGCAAEFRAMDQMLYFAVGLAMVIGFLFAAPGAVMISGQITRKENGIISAAGPLVNYVLALVFMYLALFVPALHLGFWINLWLGLFNMIPFGNFDGKKILAWNRYVWLGMVAFGVYFLFFI